MLPTLSRLASPGPVVLGIGPFTPRWYGALLASAAALGLLLVPPGRLFLVYLVLYSIARIPIEALRLDGGWLGPYRSAHVLAMLCLLASVLSLVGLRHRPRAPDATRPLTEG